MALVPALCLLAGSAAWAGSATTKAAVFRWVDEKGEVHYGDHLPMAGVDAEGKVRSTGEKTSPTPAATPAAAAKTAPETKDPKDAKAPADRAKQ
ncbi:MAG TPA: DUF4124 domain-containing protein [Myxococcota bacterium]|nr:DUF4124 domain-containing protein [Myxococcota bacterium]